MIERSTPGALRALSVYSGAGGLDRAALAAGVEVVALCEADPFCRRLLAVRFPGVPIYESDTTLTADRLAADGIGRIDLVFGGPPCQPASSAGKRLGASDPRWRWPEYFRLVRDLRPRWVVAEQPPGILSLHGGRPWAWVQDQLDALGYRVGWSCYGADAVGAPHRRERVFLLASLADADGSQPQRAGSVGRLAGAPGDGADHGG